MVFFSSGSCLFEEASKELQISQSLHKRLIAICYPWTDDNEAPIQMPYHSSDTT